MPWRARQEDGARKLSMEQLVGAGEHRALRDECGGERIDSRARRGGRWWVTAQTRKRPSIHQRVWTRRPVSDFRACYSREHADLVAVGESQQSVCSRSAGRAWGRGETKLCGVVGQSLGWSAMTLRNCHARAVGSGPERLDTSAGGGDVPKRCKVASSGVKLSVLRCKLVRAAVLKRCDWRRVVSVDYTVHARYTV